MTQRRTFILATTALSLFLLCAITTFAIQQQPRPSTNAIKKTIKRLAPLHTKLGKPKEGEWLDNHKERGQTFAQYVRIRPNVLSATRNKLYVQPIGEFTDKQKNSSHSAPNTFHCISIAKSKRWRQNLNRSFRPPRNASIRLGVTTNY